MSGHRRTTGVTPTRSRSNRSRARSNMRGTFSETGLPATPVFTQDRYTQPTPASWTSWYRKSWSTLIKENPQRFSRLSMDSWESNAFSVWPNKRWACSSRSYPKRKHAKANKWLSLFERKSLGSSGNSVPLVTLVLQVCGRLILKAPLSQVFAKATNH